MSITIDSSGRLVIPKALRDAAGIHPGMPLEARLRDGRIEIEPAPLEVDIVAKGGIQVAVPRDRVLDLTSEEVEETIDRVRSERG